MQFIEPQRREGRRETEPELEPPFGESVISILSYLCALCALAVPTAWRRLSGAPSADGLRGDGAQSKDLGAPPVTFMRVTVPQRAPSASLHSVQDDRVFVRSVTRPKGLVASRRLRSGKFPAV